MTAVSCPLVQFRVVSAPVPAPITPDACAIPNTSPAVVHTHHMPAVIVDTPVGPRPMMPGLAGIMETVVEDVDLWQKVAKSHSLGTKPFINDGKFTLNLGYLLDSCDKIIRYMGERIVLRLGEPERRIFMSAGVKVWVANGV